MEEVGIQRFWGSTVTAGCGVGWKWARPSPVRAIDGEGDVSGDKETRGGGDKERVEAWVMVSCFSLICAQMTSCQLTRDRCRCQRDPVAATRTSASGARSTHPPLGGAPVSPFRKIWVNGLARIGSSLGTMALICGVTMCASSAALLVHRSKVKKRPGSAITSIRV